ncbi:hypothetical protein HDU86_004814 [Geranomyces michiganensis]|nr:hypothetical protein HDU86_004814 [Geranomyces michiganensis]
MAVTATAATSMLLPPHTADLGHATPTDYLLLPSTFKPPNKRFVGLLACQADPFLRTLETKVVRVERTPVDAAAKTAVKKKEKKPSSAASDAPLLVEWQFEFEDTVLFPEGGGQPCDHGIIEVIASGKKLSFDKVVRIGLDAVHCASFPADADPSADGWVPGAAVRMELAWDRRRDHMQQHSGQHLISAVFEQELQIETHGWSLTAEGACYVDLLKEPSQAQIDYVNKRANQLIAEGRKVTVEVRLDTESDRPGSMPGDYKDGVIRYVSIDKLEVNPCCGTHYPSLSFLQSVFIYPGVQTISGPPRSRMYFAIGDRVLASLATYHATLKDISGQLLCGLLESPTRLTQVLAQKKESTRREKVLRVDALRALAADLSAGLKLVNGVMVGRLHREDDSTDVDFLVSLLQDAFKPPTTTLKDDGSLADWLVIVSGGAFSAAGKEAGGTGGCLVMVGSSDALVKKGGDELKAKLGGKLKGGGKGRWQGKVTGAWIKSDMALLDEVLEKAAAA